MSKMDSSRHDAHGGDCAACELGPAGACGSIMAFATVAGGLPFVCHTFEPGALICREGGLADGLHFIVSGGVKLVRADPAGNERIVRIAHDGDVVCFAAITAGACEHTAIALDEVRTCRIPADKLPQVLARRPLLQMKLMRQMQAALSETECWISELASGVVPARVRLARLLLRLRIDEGNRVRRLQLTEMGSILGQTPETVCRTLKAFEQDKVLEPQGGRGASRHYVADLQALRQLAFEGADLPGTAVLRDEHGNDITPLPRTVRCRRGEAGLHGRSAIALHC